MLVIEATFEMSCNIYTPKTLFKFITQVLIWK